MTTIYKAFKQALVDFPRHGEQTKISDQASGSTTEECKPPKCGIKIPVDHWTHMAKKYLEKHKAELKAVYLPTTEDLVGFKSEADVVIASTLYLTHPVHVAYQLANGGDTRLNELTKPQEGTTGGSSRPDSVYFSGPPKNKQTPGKSNNTILVLEYKKYEGISREDFEDGIVSNRDAYARTVNDPPFHKPDSEAYIVLKQATHYATRFRTPFVALCDYKTLILLVMHKAEGTDGGEYTYVTIVKDSKKMRKAYLGFLLAAKSNADGDDGWRTNRKGTDVLAKGEKWEQELESRRPKKKNKERKGRNKNPTHDSPSSQEGSTSKGQVSHG